MGFLKIKSQGQSQSRGTLAFMFFLKNKQTTKHNLANGHKKHICKQIHMEKKFQKNLYSFIETYFLTNANPYGRSRSLRRVSYYNTCIVIKTL